MSASITGTTIKLTRGDSMFLALTIYDDAGDPYEPLGTETVRFAVKGAELNRAGTEFVDEEPLVEKSMTYDSTDNTWSLHLVPSDTAALGFGNYKYDIQITIGSDNFTVVADAKLKLTPEVD